MRKRRWSCPLNIYKLLQFYTSVNPPSKNARMLIDKVITDQSYDKDHWIYRLKQWKKKSSIPKFKDRIIIYSVKKSKIVLFINPPITASDISWYVQRVQRAKLNYKVVF